MLIIISPAKTLDFESEIPENAKKLSTAIKYPSESTTIANALKSQTKANLKKMFNVSDNIANLNYNRYKNFKTENVKSTGRPSIFSFDGPAYKGFDAISEKENLDFYKKAQDRLRILCGLYGYVRPLDLIQEYRLEMSNKFSFIDKDSGEKFTNLYDFWREKLTQDFIDFYKKKSKKSKILINVASNEYSKAIDFDQMIEKIPDIEICNFKFLTEGRQASVYSKQARGLMARYVIKNDILEAGKLSGFNLDGYKFKNREKDGTFVFDRKKPAPKSSSAKKRKV